MQERRVGVRRGADSRVSLPGPRGSFFPAGAFGAGMDGIPHASHTRLNGMTTRPSDAAGPPRVERITRAPETVSGEARAADALFTVDAELVEAAERTEAFLTGAVERATAAGALAGRGIALISGGAGRLLLGHAGAEEASEGTEPGDWRARLRRAERRTGRALERLSESLQPGPEPAAGSGDLALSRAIRRHPAVALGVAAAGGLAIGLLLRRLP